MKFGDIPKLPRAYYRVDVDWGYLEVHLNEWAVKNAEIGGLEMNPDYQRGHVWTREQQISFVEYALTGGETGREITWNSPDWGGSYKRPTELVDGKQRIAAVLAFLRDEIPAFDTMRSEYEDHIRMTDCKFTFRVCKLKTREEVLQLYLGMNSGGTPHAAEEIERVREMLAKERGEQ